MDLANEMQLRIDTKSYCEVCGDKARGCNFDAITCASCKEFFRRNAFKQKGLKCYFQNNCTIDVVSRRFCASCRLRKCLSAGMKKEYIMSEEQRHARKEKIIEKKRSKVSRKRDSLFEVPKQLDQLIDDNDIVDEYKEDNQMQQPMIYNISTDHHLSPSSPSKPTEGLKSPDLPIGSTVCSEMFGIEEKPYFLSRMVQKESVIISKLSNKKPNQLQNKFNDEHSLKTTTSDVESIRKLLSKVKIMRESNYYPTKYALLCRASENNREKLTPTEKYKLKHLTSNVQLMQAETIHELPCSGRFIDVLKITEIITFMLIKMCKKLLAFQQLSQSDQIAVVKGACMETLILRSIMSINLEKECWESMDLERNCKFSLKMEVLKQVNQKVYEAHRKYALSFEPEWRFDDNVMSCLIAISIFSPDRPNLTNVHFIRSEQQSYINLLKRYLQTIYDGSTAETIFYRLMDQIKLTKTTSEVHVKAYFDVNTNQIEETGISSLLMEIFDLKNTDKDKDNNS